MSEDDSPSLSQGFDSGEAESGADDKVDAWIVTYADMMSLLLTFFILLLAIADFDPGKMEQRIKAMSMGFVGQKSSDKDAKKDKTEDVKEQLKKIIEEANLEDSVRLTSDTRGIVLYAKGDILFTRGKAKFRKDAKYFLNSVIKVIKKAPNKILVEGHTDDVPIKTAQFPSNWELSASRAGAVIRYFIRKGKISPARCAAVGYAHYKPRFPMIPENRARNRRVEIILLNKRF